MNMQPNGEPKNNFLTKPPDQSDETPGPSTSTSPPPYRPVKAYVGNRVRVPPKRNIHPADKNPDEHLTNHRKQRYWNSWEELYIVELWRRYRDEVTILNVPLPVYRKMMVAMRNRNMILTAQDCRRKVNTLNTRYNFELKKMESTGGKSDWRLFPLLHCIMSPKVKQFDSWHGTKIIKKLLDKIPRRVEVTPPPVPNPSYDNQNQQTNSLPTSSQSLNTCPPQRPMPSSETPITVIPFSSAYKLPSPLAPFDKRSILPFRNITWEKLENLRHDNNRLALERDENVQVLHLEEKELKNLEAYMRTLKKQKEAELLKVQQMSVVCVFKIENEENQKSNPSENSWT